MKAGDRVHDNEGDTGTVVGFDEDTGHVLVNGDASVSGRPWRYQERELTIDCEREER